MELSEALRRRRMVRNYTDEPIAPEVLTRVLAAGRRAPAAGNTNALHLILLEGAAETARYWDVTLAPERRATFRWPGLLVAPVLLIPCVRPQSYVDRYAEDDKARAGLGDGADGWPVPYWYVDGGAAIMAMLLAAVDEGLGSLLFGQFDHEPAVRAAFGIPDDVVPLGTIALGHPAPDEPGRSAKRKRGRLDEVVHRGGW
jgi:nitroreductase